jgi:hypothetical protein
MQLSPAELDTVLAALRYWQSALTRRVVPFFSFMQIAEEHGPALTAEAIDALCERINTDD